MYQNAQICKLNFEKFLGLCPHIPILGRGYGAPPQTPASSYCWDVISWYWIHRFHRCQQCWQCWHKYAKAFAIYSLLSQMTTIFGQSWRFSKEVGQFANYRWKGTLPPTIIGVRKLEQLGYLIVNTVWSYLHSSGYNTRTQQTDGRMDLP